MTAQDRVSPPTPPCRTAAGMPVNPLFFEIEVRAFGAPVARWVCPDPLCGAVHEQAFARSLLPRYRARGARIYPGPAAEARDALHGGGDPCPQ